MIRILYRARRVHVLTQQAFAKQLADLSAQPKQGSKQKELDNLHASIDLTIAKQVIRAKGSRVLQPL